MSIRKAEFAILSSNNMEYLGFLAALFVPMTLFSVLYSILKFNNQGNFRYERTGYDIRRSSLDSGSQGWITGSCCWVLSDLDW